MKTEFKNESYVDFTKEDNRRKMLETIEKVEKQLGREYDLFIGGKRLKAKTKFNSYNPSQKDQVVGIFQKAGADEANLAVETAYKKFEEWRFVEHEKRAEYLFKAADVMRRRRLELAAWMVFEVGKSWTEGDADVAEAIDFLEFYGREMLRYGGEQPITKIPGEKNELAYISLGVGVIVPPWNFPLAILVGMTSAAIVCGNTVVLKPSSDSPTIAQKFVEIMEEVRLPDGVLNFLPGGGATAGEAAIVHAKTRFIAFTGSMDVGLRINQVAAQAVPGQIWIKRVVAEMGGKDSIVVDEETDLEAAAEGVKVSAFGYSGQKCSACSRAIVVEKVYDEFLKLLVARVKAIKVGPTKSPENWMGPVVSESAYKSILEYIDIGKKEGRLLCGGNKIGDKGYFIEPTVFADIDPRARISQEEILAQCWP